MTQRVSPAVLHPLKEALASVFWYKKDLRAFLVTCTEDPSLIAQLDWSDIKWRIVSQLVDTLASAQHRYFDVLLNLLLATAEVTEPRHLLKLEDGQERYDNAVAAIKTLQAQVEPYRKFRSEAEQAALRRAEERARAGAQQAITQKLSQFRVLLQQVTSLEAQQRGYALENLLNGLFTLFDIDAKGPFRITGEQIDGAFTFEGTEFLLEAKWRKNRTPLADLDVFSAKVNRKLDNTLGLFFSINGFEHSAVSMQSQGRPSIILMDGSDLAFILEDRITLPDLIKRKRQHAARSGEIFLPAHMILS